MTDFFKNNKNDTDSSSDSARFQGKVKPEDVIKEQELRAQEIHERCHNAYEDFQDLCAAMDECIDESEVEEELFDKVFDFFNDTLDAANLENEKDYQTIKEVIFSKARKRDRLLSMLEFIKSLLKKLFGAGSSLNWQERLKKEIEDLEKELLDKDLSPEERISKLERLNLLRLVNFLGPLNFVNAIVKAITIFVALETTSLVGEGFIKELLVKEKVVLPENRGMQEEITDKFVMNIVNMLSGVVPFAQSIGALLSIAVINSVTAGVKAELRIVDTRIPYLLLPIIHEPALLKLPAEVKKVQAKPVKEPEKTAPAPAKPEPEVVHNKINTFNMRDKDPMKAKERRTEQQHSEEVKTTETEQQCSKEDVVGQLLASRANKSNVPPSTGMQETQLEQHRSDLNQGRS